MSAADELYCVLREMDVPAGKAREVLNVLQTARDKTDIRDAIETMPAFTSLSKSQLEKPRDELLALMTRHLASMRD